MKTLLLFVLMSLALLALAYAQPSAEELDLYTTKKSLSFLVDTMLFLFAGIMLIVMMIGFLLREVGFSLSSNLTIICLKSIGLVVIAGLTFWVVGYDLLYSIEPGGYFGRFAFGELSQWGVGEGSVNAAHSVYASGFYQMGGVAVCAFIVSGTLGQRVGVWAFFIFAIILCGLLYPIQASWYWGGGWLATRGFTDVAGASLIHITGGFAALAGNLMVGPQSQNPLEKTHSKSEREQLKTLTDARMPLTVIGTLVLWIGWLGLCGASQLEDGAQEAFGLVETTTNLSRMVVNTHMAACGGVIVTLVLTQIIFRKIYLPIVLSGAIGGLVSVSGDPLSPELWQAFFIGGIGGVIVTLGAQLLDRFNIDDAVGAIPAHLFCGLWGALVIAWPNPVATVVTQLIGIAAIGGFVFVMSILVLTALKYSIGLNADEKQ